jgi:hypothetical protein
MKMALHKESDFYSRSQPAKQAVALSLRSGRQHKAWGASPRLAFDNQESPRQRVTACRFHAVARFTGSIAFSNLDPGACAPGFMLSPASQA